MKRALVLVAGWFIASHLVKRLQAVYFPFYETTLKQLQLELCFEKSNVLGWHRRSLGE
jgi:hypothetical protein